MTTEPTTPTLRMKNAVIGILVTVNDETARNPGGYGRITARSPKHGKVHVDSGEFPGEEVTGWYSVENVAPYILPPAPAEPITECAICYHVGPCTDDGEALICTDRAACQARCDAVVDRLYSEFSAQAQPPDDEEEPSDEPPAPATMDEAVEMAYARRSIPLPDEERYAHTHAPTCRRCGGAHHVQRCPEINALLFQPAPLFHCPSCGDAVSETGLCAACVEAGESVNWSEGPALYTKEIVYSRDTHDYALYLNKELVGFARSYHEGEITLDQLVFELMTAAHFIEAA